MSKNLWNDEPFNDGAPVLENGEWKEPETYTPVADTILKAKAAMASQVQHDDEEELDYSDIDLELSSDEEDDFTDVLSDARLRLEQGKLYEMIMNHDLFNGVDADERASKTVQRQIRKWAKEQMEIMLGMRRESSKVERLEIDFPFNHAEVKALKDIAFKLTKGATQDSDNYVPEVKKVVEEVPVVHKKTSLNSIGSNKKQVQAKPLQKKAEPIKREAAQPRPQTTKQSQPNVLTGKSLQEMNDQERAEYLKGVNERNQSRAQVIPPDRAPMPDAGTMEMLAASQASRALGGKSNLSAAIMGALKKTGKI